MPAAPPGRSDVFVTCFVAWRSRSRQPRARQLGVDGLRLTVAALLGALGLALTAGSADAKKMTLPELLAFAHSHSPGMRAGEAATLAMEAQVSEARRYWLPSGEITSFLTALPDIRCQDRRGPILKPDPNPNGDTWSAEDHCAMTSTTPTKDPFAAITGLKGVFSRTELKLIQPVWDFGKISAGVSAAEAGVAAVRQKQAISRADIDLNLNKAYWAVKYAREARATLEEGEGYIDDAQKKIEKDLVAGSGDITVSDRLRMRTVRAEVEVRLLEAKRQETIALQGLRALLGPDSPDDLDVDDAGFDPVDPPKKPLVFFEDQARHSRPEAQALDNAVKAKHALALLEQRKLYPDLALVGTAAYAYAPTVDSPNNAFMNNPFNTKSFGLGAALRIPLDFGPKMARATRMQAEADEITYRQQEAWQGMRFEVQKAYAELTEARTRFDEVRKGEKAGKAWVAAVSQNFAVGLAEAKDLSDALLQYFKMRSFTLQATFDVNVAAAALARVSGEGS